MNLAVEKQVFALIMTARDAMNSISSESDKSTASPELSVEVEAAAPL